jgi:DNA-directed RNA polymerase specialized sigma24 family protein
MNSEELEALLRFLDSDRDQAAGHYETVRTRLTRFFHWKGCLEAEELVDDVFDRVARRLARGVEIHSADHARFFQGVARLVFYEYGRKQAKRPLLLDTGKHPVIRPAEPDWSRQALLSCLEELRPQDQALILEYYDLESVVRPEDGATVLEQSAEGARGSRRRRLAERYGLNVNSLRIRVHRIRSRLEGCVRSRLDTEPLRKS